MKVVIECYGVMREFLPDPSTREAGLDVAGSTVGDVVDALGASRRLVYAVLVDGGRASLDTRLEDGSRVTLMPPFAGGAHIKGVRAWPRQRPRGRSGPPHPS
jgi:molybdopterin converting factor small subunit